MKMNEAKDVYKLIGRIWELFKKYGFHKPSDSEWEEMINTVSVDLQQMQEDNIPKRFIMLYRDLFSAMQNYYKRIGNDNG